MWAMRHRVSLACGALVVLGSGACSDASYDKYAGDSAVLVDGGFSEQAEKGNDASVDATGATQDAEPTVPPRDAESEVEDDAGPAQTFETLPDWAASLIGQYGIRARYFNRDSVGVPGRVEWVMLGTFAFDAASGHVTLTTQLCEALGYGTVLGAPVESGPTLPQNFTPRVYNVSHDASGWSTDGTPLRVGFAAEPLVPCTPGARVKADTTQTWNADGQCLCPTDLNALPDHSRDCRVTDADGDGAPAATVAFRGGVMSSFHVLQYDTSRIVRGTIDAVGRHHNAQYAVAQQNVQLTCGDAPCVKMQQKLCGSEDNPVSVSPLGAPGELFECKDVLDRKATLFDTAVPMFPTGGC